MSNNEDNKNQFSVLCFIQKPFEGIDRYVCVPTKWVVYRITDKEVVAAYPRSEEPSKKRERAKKQEKHKREWEYCKATLEYQSDTYEGAELWISNRNNHRSSRQENSNSNACNAARSTVRLLPVHHAAPQPNSTLPLPLSTPMSPRMEPVTFTPAYTICEDAASTTSPLGRLRSAMRSPGYTQSNAAFDAFLVFYSDEHLSEEPAADERRLEYISGWAGVGTAAVVAEGGAAVWVPSGDVTRARAALSCAWIVMDADDPTQPTIAEWLAPNIDTQYRVQERIAPKMRVGGDARLTSVVEWHTLSASLQKESLQLVHVPTLLDQLWQDEMDPTRIRPEFSRKLAWLQDLQYTGMTWKTKVALVRNELQALGADAMVVAALDEVGWLLNIRGLDVPHAPLLKAFVIISSTAIRLYVPPGKLFDPEILANLTANVDCVKANCTVIQEYTSIYSDLRRSSESRILIPTAGTFQRGASAAIAQSVPQNRRLFQPSPIIYLKAQKNAAEINGMKKAHLRDAVAISMVLHNIEKMMRIKTPLTEVSVADNVRSTSKGQVGYLGESMTIRVAYGPNGAEPEYLPTNKTDLRVMYNSTLIIQSGGQYKEGTTMVTRTLQYGGASQETRKAYTTVLRSLAALGTLQIPATLPAAHVDPFVRAPLWANKKDYPYPTGHGIGAALNRREDPVVLDYRQDTNLHTFREGYFIAAEPAWYDPNKFGVRLGNVLQVVGKSEGMLTFLETTLVPFEPKLIDNSLLTEYEINWLNSYNERIRNILGTEFKELGKMDLYYWVQNKTVPIVAPSKAMRRTCNSSGQIKALLLTILSSIIISFV